LPHFEHAANVITVVNAQLRVISIGIKVYVKQEIRSMERVSAQCVAFRMAKH